MASPLLILFWCTIEYMPGIKACTVNVHTPQNLRCML